MPYGFERRPVFTSFYIYVYKHTNYLLYFIFLQTITLFNIMQACLEKTIRGTSKYSISSKKTNIKAILEVIFIHYTK